jgi:alkanesulfonate monooxygenase SsuD/methylene tetrahydromethanopterin reductase-like flavin-dependent oxidoreductase (luciferase family)
LKIGIALPQIGEQATTKNVIMLSREAEQEASRSFSFDSLWVNDRMIWPLNPLVPSPVTPDGRLPLQFQNVFDPLELLTFVAANTNKIKLGTAIVNMLFHNPVVLARRFATLDVLSEGRIIASGFGLGSVKEEYQIANIPFESRGKRADEFLQVLKKTWTDDIVEFKGNFYTIPASSSLSGTGSHGVDKIFAPGQEALATGGSASSFAPGHEKP